MWKEVLLQEHVQIIYNPLMQRAFNLYKGKWGGRRPGAGRKRIHSKGVAHRSRELVNHRFPLHINFKVSAFIRNKVCLRILKRAILNARQKGLRIRHYSLQSNHIHLIVEADDNSILESGMRSLTVTFAKGLRLGKVQKERYHLHVLKSLREVRNAVHYVWFNEEKHRKLKKAFVSPYSSLQFVRDLKSLAKTMKMTIVAAKPQNNFLDPADSWLLKRAENLSTS